MKKLILLFLIPLVSIYANVVGNFSGNLSVNNGALNYNIPLELPAGTAGVKPNISLNYNSNGGNGYFGQGWALTPGQNSISRCGSSIALDGIKKGVKYTLEDNICLDGQRLIVTSGSKWGVGSEYRTKIDSYSKIVYDGANFKVYTKSGDIKEYTNINQIWYLTRIKDKYNNAIIYNYTQVSSSEQILTSITYADNTIVFNYEDKLDKSNGYSSGYNTQITKRIRTIIIKNNTNTLRTYTFIYNPQTNLLHKSFLSKITLCSEDTCLTPLTFNTQARTENSFFNMDLSRYSLGGNGDPNRTRVADFNGDGLSDLLYTGGEWYPNQRNFVMLNQGNGTFTRMDLSRYSLGGNGDPNRTRIADFNGDGKADLLYIGGESYPNQRNFVMLSRGDGTFTNMDLNKYSLGGNGDPSRTKVADFNGDGLADLLYTSGEWYPNQKNLVMLNLGNGVFSSFDLNRHFVGGNGDPKRIKVADFNGDGSSDIIYIGGEGYPSQRNFIMFSKGDGTFTNMDLTNYSLGGNGDPNRTTIADFNGDGLADLLYTGGESYPNQRNFLMLNQGKGSFVTMSIHYYSLGGNGDPNRTRVADFDGDGSADILYISGEGYPNQRNFVMLSKSKNIENLRINKITDSHGNETNINYKRLTDSSVYTKYTDASYPNKDVQNSMSVVSSVSSPTADGTISTTSYSYEGLKTDLKGLGSLGFAKIISTNNLNNIKIVTKYNQSYPFVGMVKSTSTYMDNIKLAESSNTYNSSLANNIYKIYMDETISKNYQDGVLLSTTTNKNLSFDAYGNILNSTSTIKDETTNEEFTSTTVNTYLNNGSDWIIGKPTSTTSTSTAYGDTKTKTSNFTYDTTTGSLLSTTVEPSSSKWLKKEYGYDSKGNKISESVSGADIGTITTTYTYDSLGKYPITITNALGLSTSKTYNAYGQVLSTTAPNGLSKSYEYDSFGKKTKEIHADGTTTNYNYSYDSGVSGSLYKTVISKDGTPTVTTYYNSLGMELQSVKVGYEDKNIITTKSYNKFGKVVSETKPHFEGDSAQTIYYTYDDYNRLTQTDSSGDNGRIQNNISYDGFNTTTTNALGQTKTTRKNVLGKVVKVQEELGATIDYSYDALGNLLQTTDSTGINVTLTYDNFGNKISQDDPDMGYWTYTYNSLGKLVSQTDAKGQTSTITYDAVGRKVSESISDSTSTWEYDSLGRLYKEIKKDLSGDSLYEKLYSYDNLSRVSSLTITIDDKTFIKTYSYDSYGRISEKSLPNGFKLINTYDSNGYLLSIKSPKSQIEDFDATHFVNLIQTTLDTAEDTYRTYLNLMGEANELYTLVDEYRAIASDSNTSTSDAEQLNTIADQLEANADAYKFEAEYNKKQSDYYKSIAQGYLDEALNSNAMGSITNLSEFYTTLYNIYNTYSSNLLAIATEYINNASNTTASQQDIEYYLSISTESLDDATTANQKATNFETLAANYSGSGSMIDEYQDILSDSEYNYFYKVLEYNAYTQANSYLSGNGLVTNTSYNESGTISGITTGYNFDDGIRDLSFEYDDIGNVLSRTDAKLNTIQTYSYDNLNRVVDTAIQTATSSEYLSYNYDITGNMTYKSDIGTYSYNPYTHQVVSAGDKTFTYDANGNVVSNGTDSFIYTPFNKPSTIQTPNDIVSFYYDMNKQRYKKDTATATTYYIDKVYENITSPSTNKHKYFIYVNGKVIAVYNSSNSISSTKYLHYDSLGSIDTITDNYGAVDARMAYKPFGAKLNLDKNGVETTTPPFTNRGYTGHEHIEGTNFIHMNARVYDSSIARFMSADTMIPYMYNSQSYNRYSYVRNNPLKYVDPTGHWGSSFKRHFKRAVKAHINIVKKVVKVHVKVAKEIVKAQVNIAEKVVEAHVDVAEKIGEANPVAGAVVDGAKHIAKEAKKHKNEIAIAAAMYYTGGLASSWAMSMYGTSFTGMIAAGATSGAISGATAAFLSHGGSMGDALKAGLEGAVTGGINGAISGSLSYGVRVARISSQSEYLGTLVKSGINAKLHHGDFMDGAVNGTLNYAVVDAFSSLGGEGPGFASRTKVENARFFGVDQTSYSRDDGTLYSYNGAHHYEGIDTNYAMFTDLQINAISELINYY